MATDYTVTLESQPLESQDVVASQRDVLTNLLTVGGSSQVEGYGMPTTGMKLPESEPQPGLMYAGHEGLPLYPLAPPGFALMTTAFGGNGDAMYLPGLDGHNPWAPAQPKHVSLQKPEHEESRAKRRGPMDEMRQLVRIMVKVLPQSVKFLQTTGDGGGNRVTEPQIKAYLDSTLGEEAPRPEWGLPSGWGAYLAELFTWATDQNITDEQARTCACRQQGRSWQIKEHRLADLGIYAYAWPLPLTKEATRAANDNPGDPPAGSGFLGPPPGWPQNKVHPRSSRHRSSAAAMAANGPPALPAIPSLPPLSLMQMAPEPAPYEEEYQPLEQQPLPQPLDQPLRPAAIRASLPTMVPEHQDKLKEEQQLVSQAHELLMKAVAIRGPLEMAEQPATDATLHLMSVISKAIDKHYPDRRPMPTGPMLPAGPILPSVVLPPVPPCLTSLPPSMGSMAPTFPMELPHLELPHMPQPQRLGQGLSRIGSPSKHAQGSNRSATPPRTTVAARAIGASKLSKESGSQGHNLDDLVAAAMSHKRANGYMTTPSDSGGTTESEDERVQERRHKRRRGAANGHPVPMRDDAGDEDGGKEAQSGLAGQGGQQQQEGSVRGVGSGSGLGPQASVRSDAAGSGGSVSALSGHRRAGGAVGGVTADVLLKHESLAETASGGKVASVAGSVVGGVGPVLGQTEAAKLRINILEQMVQGASQVKPDLGEAQFALGLGFGPAKGGDDPLPIRPLVVGGTGRQSAMQPVVASRR